MTDIIKQCDVVDSCEDCPRYGDDCDGTAERLYTHEEAWGMTDLISRADVLKYPIRLDHYDEEHGNIDFVLGIESVMEYVEALPSADAVSREECDECKTDKEGVLLQQLAELQGDYETMKNAYEDALADAEWIPCSERLPLASGEFLVTLVDHDGAWVSTAQWNMTFGGRWQDIFPNDGYRDISNVIAWKTLPIPYREDGEA